MLLRIACSLVFVILVRFIATSQNPEVAEFRHLLAVTTGMVPGEMPSAEDTRSNMERLQARNSTADAPCIMQDQCRRQGGVRGLANRIATDWDRVDAATSDSASDIKPLFIQVEPNH
jgi:hypothetical protein